MAGNQITAILAPLTPNDRQRPWPRYNIGPETWIAIGRAIGLGEGDLLGLWADRDEVHLALRAAELATPCVVSIRVADGRYPALGHYHLPAIRCERAIRDLYGYEAEGAPDRRPWFDHGAWEQARPLGARQQTPLRDPAGYSFLPVAGEGLHQIPVGPVHAGIIEPGHFRFTANGETVVRLEERLGYVHKGIDALLSDTDIEGAARVVARTSGDSTVAYSFAFARAVEAATGIDVPARAVMLRGVMAELERLANHLGDIGAICNDAAFVLIHAHCGIFRERILQVCERAFGHRLMMDRILPGGVTHDITQVAADDILQTLDDITPRFAKIVELYDETPSLQDRTCRTGFVSHDLARQWAAGGYVGRASGRSFDARRDCNYPPYDAAPVDVPVLNHGDVDARVWVRIHEVRESMRLVRHWLPALASGNIRVPVPAPTAETEGVALVEAFRGDVLIWLRLAGSRIVRAYARDASWFQWPLLEAAIEGNIVADFPLCNKSFNCSYSGHDL